MPASHVLRRRAFAPLLCLAILAGCGGGSSSGGSPGGGGPGGGGGGGTPPPSNGTIELLAGSLQAGGSANGVGAAAEFQQPKAVAQDAAGVTYVADTGNHTIRRIAPDGTVTTLAGSPGASGAADGIGAVARFSAPAGLVLHPQGGVIVADTGNHTLRRVTADGTVTTYAGAPGQSGAADGPVAAARFTSPRALAYDLQGNLLVGDLSGAVRTITVGGVVSTFAGKRGELGDTVGSRGDARFQTVSGIAVDGAGTVYVAETDGNGRIRRFDAQGTALAWGALPQGVLSISSPVGIAARGTGDLLVLSSGTLQFGPRVLEYHSNLQRVNASGVATRIAGGEGGQGGQTSLGSADGAGTAARFHYPEGIAIAPNGRVVVADTQNNAIRQIVDTTVTTLAGGAGIGRVDGAGGTARFFDPTAIADAKDGTLLVADSRNARVRRVTKAGDVSTLTFTQANVSGSFQELAYQLTALAVSPAGTPYLSRVFGSTYSLARVEGNLLREVAVTWSPTLAADGSERVYTSNGGIQSVDSKGVFTNIASLQARALAVEPGGRLYGAMLDHLIRVFEPDGTTRILAGVPGQAGATDGSATSARFDHPSAIALGAGGDLYVADAAGIRRVSADGRVRTVASSASQVVGAGNAAPLLRALGRIKGLAWLDGALYATSENAVLRVTPAP